MPNEQPIPLQVDNVSTLPGGGVRTLVATVLVAGVPTQVSMQVVVLADANGAMVDPRESPAWAVALLAELRAIKQLLAAGRETLVLDTDLPPQQG